MLKEFRQNQRIRKLKYGSEEITQSIVQKHNKANKKERSGDIENRMKRCSIHLIRPLKREERRAQEKITLKR